MLSHAESGDDANAASTMRSTLIGWLVLGTIVALLPAQAAWYAVMDSEPYPALSQPAFNIVPGASGQFTGSSTSMTVITKSGSTVSIPREAVFAASGNQRSYVIASLAESPSLDARSRVAVVEELSRFVPADEIQALQIDVQRTRYQPDGNIRLPDGPVKRTVLDLTGIER